MTVNEFVKLIDLYTLNEQEITIIIPIQEKYMVNNFQQIGNCLLSEKEKIIFECTETAIDDFEKYEPFGIKPCSSDFEYDGYEKIDIIESKDGYKFIYNEDGEVWVIIH